MIMPMLGVFVPWGLIGKYLFKYPGIGIGFLIAYGLFLLWILSQAAMAAFKGLVSLIEQRKAKRRAENRLRNLVLPDCVSRAQVAEVFNSFANEQHRLRFVQILIASHPQVGGEWPGGRLPATGNDPASIMLAQWEERERGLD